MKREHKILIGIILAVLAFKGYFTFQSENLATDASYYNYKHIDYIAKNFIPLWYDELSYGGRIVIDSHIFHYFMAPFYIISIYVVKAVLLLFEALTILLIFILSKNVSKSSNGGLFAAAIAGFTPIILEQTLNQINIYSIVFPILLLGLYALIEIEKHTNFFIAISILLPLIHQLNFILVLTFLFYLLFAWLEGINLSGVIKEGIIFSIIITILLNLIVFKKVFFEFGIKSLWGNIPEGLLANYFTELTIPKIVNGIGIALVIIGTIGLAIVLKRGKDNKDFAGLALLSLSTAVLLLLIFKMIPFKIGLSLLAIVFAIASAVGFAKLSSYLSLTKFHKKRKLLMSSFVLLILGATFVPALLSAVKFEEDGLNDKEIEALLWIKDNTPTNITVLADIFEGNLITAIANRKNVADTNFLFAPNRYDDISAIFSQESLVKNIHLIGKYGVTYVYYSKRTIERYKVKLKYFESEECFEKEFENDAAQIYRVRC